MFAHSLGPLREPEPLDAYVCVKKWILSYYDAIADTIDMCAELKLAELHAGDRADDVARQTAMNEIDSARQVNVRRVHEIQAENMDRINEHLKAYKSACTGNCGSGGGDDEAAKLRQTTAETLKANLGRFCFLIEREHLPDYAYTLGLLVLTDWYLRDTETQFLKKEIANIICKKAKQEYSLSQELITCFYLGAEIELDRLASCVRLSRERFHRFTSVLATSCVACTESSLSLSRVSLKRLHSNAFVRCNQLTKLHLSAMRISGLGNLLRNLPALRELDLSRNLLQTLQAHMFASLTVLENLNLAANSIHTIDCLAFNGLVSLRQLNLSGNVIRNHQLDYSLQSLPRLSKLAFVVYCTQPIDLSRLAHLESLEIRECYNTINTFGQFTRLQHLHFAPIGPLMFADSISSLECLELNLVDMQQLDLDSFQPLSGLRQLELFNLSSMLFEQFVMCILPKIAVQLQSLSFHFRIATERHVSIRNDCTSYLTTKKLRLHTLEFKFAHRILNFMQVWYEIFANVSTLRVLRMDSCTVGTLCTTFLRGLPHLEELKLTRCQLVEIEDHAFGQLGHLKCLDLSHNILSQIGHSTFAGLCCLRQLSLKGNPIEGIAADAIKTQMPLLKHIQLDIDEPNLLVNFEDERVNAQFSTLNTMCVRTAGGKEAFVRSAFYSFLVKNNVRVLISSKE